jgi:hypothetical protein
MRLLLLVLTALNISCAFAQDNKGVENAFIAMVFETLELKEGKCPPDSDYNYRCARGTNDEKGLFQFNDLLLQVEDNVSNNYTQFAFKQMEINFEYPIALGNIDFVAGGSVVFMHQTLPNGNVLVIFSPSSY